MINAVHSLIEGNILQPETIVLNVSGRVLMVNREINGNASEQLVSVLLIEKLFYPFVIFPERFALRFYSNIKVSSIRIGVPRS